jgi:hypothetical protein
VWDCGQSCNTKQRDCREQIAAWRPCKDTSNRETS